MPACPPLPSKGGPKLRNCTRALDLESGGLLSSSSSSSSLTNKQGKWSGVEWRGASVRWSVVARAYGPFLGIRVSPPSPPSCVASLLHKSLRWLVCYVVGRSPKHFSSRAPQTSLARSLGRSLYPSGSFALPGLAPYWPHATRRRAANTHTHTHSHTQAACNSVIDSPLVRRVPISLSPSSPSFFATRFTPFASTADAVSAAVAVRVILGPATLPDVILGLCPCPCPQPASPSHLPTLRLTAGVRVWIRRVHLDSDSAVRLNTNERLVPLREEVA